MLNVKKCTAWLTLLIGWVSLSVAWAQKIDRQAVVNRHRVVITGVDTLGSLTVGNGEFAFTVDATGLQSFPEHYARGIPLGTQSEWGWHRFPNPEGYQYDETLETYEVSGRRGAYAVQFKQPGRQQRATDYYRQNPHRLQLGNVGLVMQKKDGTEVRPDDLRSIRQELDLWTGTIRSTFEVEGMPVSVITCAHTDQDAIAVRVTSDLIKQGRLQIRFRFPSPTGAFTDVATNYANASLHHTVLSQASASTALFSRQLDRDAYYVAAQWGQSAKVEKVADHDFRLVSTSGSSLEVSVRFSASLLRQKLPSFAITRQSSATGWKKFWLSGAAIDFAGSTDVRAAELERRVVLSQYLTRVQCAGHMPPQETGLTYNSWFGRPHMEMYWWHAAHYALWGRAELLEKSLNWYFTALSGAEQIARRQGFRGVRWQKMTDPDGGEGPSSIGSFLIWQQPHVIYLSELIYRNQPSQAVLQRYGKLIFATADFMASFARYDSATAKYHLGKGIIPAQECFDPAETYNPPFELAYWKWGLQMAQQWRIRMGMGPNATWQYVIDHLAPLAQRDGVYQAAESVTDSYSPNSKYTIDHPAVLAALSSLPANGMVDTTVVRRTYEVIEKTWHWNHTWGWDFPMIAMTTTRLQQPQKAVDALFRNVTTNTYLVNGHNYQDKRLTLYLPGNGVLLAAIALMCAGTDDLKTNTPGFPKNGQWQVQWEGLKPFP